MNFPADLYYPDSSQKVRPVVTDPPTEIVTLDDYRRRYRLYRLDPDLQALTAKVPLISITDDHEYMNNAWMTFAENHQPTGVYPGGKSKQGAGFDQTPYPEGDFYTRMQSALEAFTTYMPIRDLPSSSVITTTGTSGSWSADTAAINTAATSAFGSTYYSGSSVASAYYDAATLSQVVPGSAATNVTARMRWQMSKQQRAFTFPGLMTYAMTEDRVSYRTSAQAADQNGFYSSAGVTDLGALSPVVAAMNTYLLGPPSNWSATALASVAQAYKLYTMPAGVNGNCSDSVDGGCTTSYSNPNNHLIGTNPIAWLGQQFAASKTASVPFQVWASQTCFFPSAYPDMFSAAFNGPLATAAKITPRPTSMDPAIQRIVSLYGSVMAGIKGIVAGGMAKLPWNADGWDGFQFERQLLINTISAAGNNVIVNSGDAHTFWISKLAGTSATTGMSEYCGGSVSSPGWGDAFGSFGGPSPGKPVTSANLPLLNNLEDGFMISDSPNLMASRGLHGALLFSVTSTTYTGQMLTVDNIANRTYNTYCDGAWVTPSNKPGTMIPTACVSTINGGSSFSAFPVPGAPPPSPSPSPSPPPLPPSPPPANVQVMLSSSVTLTGASSLSFADAMAFSTVIAATISVPVSAVAIVSTTSGSGRHLLQATVLVAFKATMAGIAYPNATAALNNLAPTTFAAALASAGMTWVSSATVGTTTVDTSGVLPQDVRTTGMLTGTPGIINVNTPTTPSKERQVGLGAGLGLGLPLLFVSIALCGCWLFSGPRTPAAPKAVEANGTNGKAHDAPAGPDSVEVVAASV